METAWLLSPEGRELLSSIGAYDEARALSLATSLRERGYSPEQVSAALTQARLRERARAKFGPLAEELFFTANGYEQSTRWAVAQAHAARFRNVGAHSVIDLGCGIGADSLAFARAGLRVTAVESDPTTAAFAEANVPEAIVICGDGTAIELPDADAMWLDPARRTPAGARIKKPEDWSPSYWDALELTSAYRFAGIKVAPGIAHNILPHDSEVVWTSERGEVVEAVVWRGMGRGRSAVVDGKVFDSGAEHADDAVRFTPPLPLGSLLLEPDGAIIRSGGIAALAQSSGCAPISEGIAYLSGEEPVAGCAAFRILDVVTHKPKAIKAALAAHGFGPLEIKKRGTDTDIDDLRKKLGKRSGTRPGVLILSPVMGEHKAIIAERLQEK